MKNKKLTILLASALVAGAAMMTGCGGESNPTPPSPPDANATKPANRRNSDV